MISVEPTEDEKYIKSMLFHPSIYKDMCDDSCPKDPKSLWEINVFLSPSIFLKVISDGKEVGLFWVRLASSVMAEVHTALLPIIRGKRAIDAAKKGIDWLFKNTEIKFIFSYAWSDAPSVAWFCRAVGLKHINTMKWPNTRNGAVVDIMYYGLTKEKS